MTFHPDPMKCECLTWAREMILSDPNTWTTHHKNCERYKPRDPGCKLPSTEIGTNLGDMLKKALEQPEAQGGR